MSTTVIPAQYTTELIGGMEIEKPLPKKLHSLVEAFLIHWLFRVLGFEQRDSPQDRV